MRPLTAAVHHLAILVSNLARSERFYTEVLGLRVLRRWSDTTGMAERAVWLDLGEDAFLALERVPDITHDDHQERVGHHLVALRIAKEERPVWRERLAQAGHAITHETPFTLYFNDPEGNRLGLSHWPEPATDSLSDATQ